VSSTVQDIHNELLYLSAMSRASPFHPIRRPGPEFVVRAFSNSAIRGFLVTLVSWRVLDGIALRVLAAVAVDCCCFIFNAHICDLF